MLSIQLHGMKIQQLRLLTLTYSDINVNNSEIFQASDSEKIPIHHILIHNNRCVQILDIPQGIAKDSTPYYGSIEME